MLKRVLGVVFTLLILTIVVMAVIEKVSRRAAPPAVVEMRQRPDSTGVESLPDSLL